MMLALCHVLLTEKLHDRAFLDKCTVGFDKLAPYLADKTPEWAAKITGIPATRIRALAREMAATRTTVIDRLVAAAVAITASSRSGALVTLACMLGQIGLPGGGFGVGYGPVNLMGSSGPRYSGPTLPQGANAVPDFIPVARFTDMLLNPGGKIHLQRARHHLPRHQAGLLGGRQSVPSPPGPQPPDGRLAQARDDRVPRAVLDAGRAHGRHRAARPPPASSATTSATARASRS